MSVNKLALDDNMRLFKVVGKALSKETWMKIDAVSKLAPR